MSEVNTFGLPQNLYDLGKAVYDQRRDLMSEEERSIPNIQTVSGLSTDINADWDNLHDLVKMEKLDDVVDIYNVLLVEKDDTEYVADYAHNLWVTRNRNRNADPKLLVSYAQLEETEKEKVRALVQLVKNATETQQ